METQSASRASVRVLVVDDEPGFRDLLKWHLQGQGMQVETAENGEDALQRLREEMFSLVITDLTMPVLSGMGMLETLNRGGRKVPVIMVSGFGTVESAVHAMKNGANDFILKPFDLEHLTDVIVDAFRRAQEEIPS